MTVSKKYWIEIGGDRFDIDKTRIAHWERFLPFAENQEFFKNYFYINNLTKGTDSLSKRIRFYSLYQSLRSALTNNAHLNVAECGCYNGCSTYIMAKLLAKHNFKHTFYIFDSFEGLSEFKAEDFTKENKHQPIANSFQANETQFKEIFNNFSFVSIKKGWIPDRFEEVKDEKFSFINIDVDIYEPTKDSLDFFYSRLSNGGCMHLDDYNFREWPGNKIALDNFLKKNNVSFFYEIPLGGCFIIK